MHHTYATCACGSIDVVAIDGKHMCADCARAYAAMRNAVAADADDASLDELSAAAELYDTATATATDLPHRWHGDSRAFIDGKHVAELVMTWGGIRLGVWDSAAGEDGKMAWHHIPRGETADELIADLHARGVLEAIPDTAELMP